MTTPTDSGAQARKLGLKPGLRVDVIAAPAGWSFAGSPDLERATSTADLILAFVRHAAELASVPAAQAQRIFPAGALWIAWPRRAAGHASDLTDTVIREAVLPLGLVDTKVAAIDHDWSGLKFVWRLENRR